MSEQGTHRITIEIPFNTYVTLRGFKPTLNRSMASMIVEATEEWVERQKWIEGREGKQ